MHDTTVFFWFVGKRVGLPKIDNPWMHDLLLVCTEILERFSTNCRREPPAKSEITYNNMHILDFLMVSDSLNQFLTNKTNNWKNWRGIITVWCNSKDTAYIYNSNKNGHKAAIIINFALKNEPGYSLKKKKLPNLFLQVFHPRVIHNQRPKANTIHKTKTANEVCCLLYHTEAI